MGSVVQPYVRLTYDYDLTYDQRSVAIQNQASSSPYEGNAFLPGRDAYTLTGGMVVKLAKNVDLTLNASTTQGQSEAHSYSVGAGLKASF
jgi:outer membrane autotransporter protein